jgi:hypothetical protein
MNNELMDVKNGELPRERSLAMTNVWLDTPLASSLIPSANEDERFLLRFPT